VLATDNFSCFDPTNKPIGDIINSTPVVVGYPAFFYPFNNYTDFKFNTIRDTMVYIGANDGSLHAIDLVSGVEQWAFIPKSMHAKLNKAQTDPLYDRCDPEFCHQYYVDGSPIVGDVYAKFDGFSDEWRTMLVIGEREGGEAYFALDVTSGRNFSDLDPTKFLWEFTDDQLGQTWADPSIDRVAVDGSATDTAWGVFFGSGYSSTDQSSKTAYLYGILAHDASMLWKDQNDMPTNRVKISRTFLNYEHEHNGGFVVGMEITGEKSLDTATIVSVDLGAKILELDYATGVFQKDEKLFVAGIHVGCITEIASEMSLVNDALASPLLVDLEADYVVDRIYVGNLYGNMYRVTNIGKHMTPQVTTLFTYGNTSADINPIRAKADYAFTDIDGEIWLYFGSGRYENQVDKQDNNQQYFFGLKDGQSPAVTYEPADLVTLQAKFKTVQIDGKDVTVRYIEGTNDYAVPWKMQLYEGTFIDGPVSSGTERVITQPLVVAGVVFFTTFIPDESVCAGNGETWVLAVDYQSGLAPTEPIFDLNGDGKFDDEDKIDIDGDGIKDTIPVGIKVGRGKGSRPVLHKDTLFITTTGDGDDGGGSGNDAEDFFAKKINLKQKKVTLEAWRYR
jgi:Tfp pilus tip-associated adhesin PilY1